MAGVGYHTDDLALPPALGMSNVHWSKANLNAK